MEARSLPIPANKTNVPFPIEGHQTFVYEFYIKKDFDSIVFDESSVPDFNISISNMPNRELELFLFEHSQYDNLYMKVKS
jgi:hypothetical protein